MVRRSFAAFAPFVLLVAAGCSAASEPTPPLEGGGARDGAIKSNKSIGAFPEVVEIDMAEIDGTGRCTGTLIGSDAVVTASHCFKNPNSGVLVRLATTEEIAAAEVVRHPMLDVAVVRLARTVGWAGQVTPLTAQAPAKMGEPVDIVGRMSDGADVGAAIFAGHANILQIQPTMYLTDLNTDHGDSGGPMFQSQGFLEDGAVPHFPRKLYAVLSGGIETDAWTRLDTPDALAFLASATAGTAPSGSSFAEGDGDGAGEEDTSGSDCGDVTFVGECDGDLVQWCEDGLQSIDCAASGLACGFDEANGFFNCL